MGREERVASVLVPELRADEGSSRTRELAAALLAGSPRVMIAAPGLCRVDARGWERRGGEEALVRTLRRAARRAGFAGARLGVADVPVASDAAARIAGEEGPPVPGSRIVPPGGARDFLAPLPLEVLPLSGGTRELLRALGIRKVGDLAGRERSELEARFGPRGLRAHRWARGEDDRLFRPLRPDETPEASVELEGAARSTEPLLFVLRRLLHRLCGELESGGWCAERIRLRLGLEEGEERVTTVAPARPTRREGLLHDLCRAALERAAGDAGGDLPAPVASVTVEIPDRAPAEARQGDLFAAEPRDPAAAAATLSRLRARLGEEAVVRPARRSTHRPEGRSRWEPAREGEGDAGGSGERGGREGAPAGDVAGVLRLLPEPRRIGIRTREGKPVELRDRGRDHGLVAAEGPERLSGDWWRAPYRREYYRACTEEGELLWLFRERRSGESVWCLHGWWD